MVCTLSSQDAPIHQILDSYLKKYRRYAPDAIILEIRSTVKVTVTPKWYETLCYSKNSEYDQEIPQSQTTPWHREEEPLNHHTTPGRQIKQSNQLSLPHQDDCNTRMDIK